MALNDSKLIKGEPTTVVFELQCNKTIKSNRVLRLVVYKLDNSPIWLFVVNDFIQQSYPDFDMSIAAALSYMANSMLGKPN